MDFITLVILSLDVAVKTRTRKTCNVHMGYHFAKNCMF